MVNKSVDDLTQNSANTANFSNMQDEIAARYPGEWVVLLGHEVYYHGFDRAEAFAKNQEIFDLEDRQYHPVVLIGGEEPEEVHGVVRGRTLAGRMPYDSDV